ncbi:MAG TPA: hypothetical protein EYP22_10865 [Methanosarcinales archaeon]|nr:hypothetical protein [Methanosarcinales archaeon]
MSTKYSKNFDDKVIQRAKEHIDTLGSSVMLALVQDFEETSDLEFKQETYELIEEILEREDAREKRIAQYRASKGLS